MVNKLNRGENFLYLDLQTSFDRHLLETCKIEFDLNNNFLVGTGAASFFIVDLRRNQIMETKSIIENLARRFQKKDPKTDEFGLGAFGRLATFHLEPMYERIDSIKVCTGGALDESIYSQNKHTRVLVNKNDLKCFMAAKLKDESTVHVFDYFQERRERQHRLNQVI